MQARHRCCCSQWPDHLLRRLHLQQLLHYHQNYHCRYRYCYYYCHHYCCSCYYYCRLQVLLRLQLCPERSFKKKKYIYIQKNIIRSSCEEELEKKKGKGCVIGSI